MSQALTSGSQDPVNLTSDPRQVTCSQLPSLYIQACIDLLNERVQQWDKTLGYGYGRFNLSKTARDEAVRCRDTLINYLKEMCDEA